MDIFRIQKLIDELENFKSRNPGSLTGRNKEILNNVIEELKSIKKQKGVESLTQAVLICKYVFELMDLL